MATLRFQALAFGDFVGDDYPRPDHCEFLSNSEHFGMSITYEQGFYLLVLAIYTKVAMLQALAGCGRGSPELKALQSVHAVMHLKIEDQ